MSSYLITEFSGLMFEPKIAFVNGKINETFAIYLCFEIYKTTINKDF